jgi:hypothetical protein
MPTFCRTWTFLDGAVRLVGIGCSPLMSVILLWVIMIQKKTGKEEEED